MPAHTPQARTSLGATLYLTSHPSTQQVEIDVRARVARGVTYRWQALEQASAGAL